MLNRIFVMLVISFALMSLDLPDYDSRLYVTDLADVFTDEQEINIDKRIREYKEMTTTEFAVCTVVSLQGTDAADFGNQLFKKWQIGTDEHNNGLLVLIAPTEHKWRIEVGYGLEPYLTDSYTKTRGDELLKPNFKLSKYFEGVDALLIDFMNKLGNSDFSVMDADRKREQVSQNESAKYGFFVFVMVVLCVILLIKNIINLIVW